MRITESRLRQIIREEKRIIMESEDAYSQLEKIDSEIQQHLDMNFERVDGGEMSYPFGRNRGDELDHQTWVRNNGTSIGRKIVALVNKYNYMKTRVQYLGFMGAYTYKPLSATDVEVRRTWRKHTAG